MNAPPESPDLAPLADTLLDAWRVRGTGDGITLSSANPFAPREARQIDQRIDYIFARAGARDAALFFERVRVVDGVDDGIPGSDHYAVAADIRF